MDTVSDLTFLKTFAANDKAKITKYVNMFVNAAEPTLSQMRLQIEAGDWSALRTSAHSLKSQLKYMGVSSGVEIAYAMETGAGTGDHTEQMPEMLTKLESVVRQAVTELKEALNTL